MNRRTISRKFHFPIGMIVTILCSIQVSCSQEDILPSSSENQSHSDESVSIRIESANANPYNTPSSGEGCPSSRRASIPDDSHSDYLVSEWVGVSHPSPTLNGIDPNYDGPRLALMDIRADSTISAALIHTKANPGTNIMFRVIVFVKNGNSYTFSSAADYKVSGTGVPTLVDTGKQLASVQINSTIRVIAYSENASTMSQGIKATYTWGEPVTFSNTDRDFMTYDSNDTQVTLDANSFKINFIHQLSLLNINLSLKDYPGSSFTISDANLQGVGNTGTWNIGTGTKVVASNSSNLALTFSSSSAKARMVAFSTARTIVLNIGTIKAGGSTGNNLSISSSSKLSTAAGKSYTMSVTFKKKPGLQISEDDITLCTGSEKSYLAKLRWADGNLKQADNSNPVSSEVIWDGPTGLGHYYTWNSTYTGSTTQNNTDPCSRLDAAKYGTGWKTPSYSTIQQLAKCANTRLTTKGMYYMNPSYGLFLPAANLRNLLGSGITAGSDTGTRGTYWSRTSKTANNSYNLDFTDAKSQVLAGNIRSGMSVRCVQGD